MTGRFWAIFAGVAVVFGVLTVAGLRLLDVLDVPLRNTLTGVVLVVVLALTHPLYRALLRSDRMSTLPGFDELIHPPTRLGLVALLAATQWAEFSFLKESLALTDSALSQAGLDALRGGVRGGAQGGRGAAAAHPGHPDPAGPHGLRRPRRGAAPAGRPRAVGPRPPAPAPPTPTERVPRLNRPRPPPAMPRHQRRALPEQAG
jgi:hypothetical protein